MCRFDLEVEIGNLAPGDYDIRFYCYDVRVDPEPRLRAILPITVCGEGPSSGGLTVVACSSSGCLGGTAEGAVPELPDWIFSWSMMKAYYR